MKKNRRKFSFLQLFLALERDLIVGGQAVEVDVGRLGLDHQAGDVDAGGALGALVGFGTIIGAIIAVAS